MRNMIFILLAIAFLIIGLAFSLTPIPLGAPLTALALVMLIGSSRFAARSLVVARMRVQLLDRMIAWLESHSGTRIGRILRRTRPQRMPRRA
jgi:hypothetical protein